MGEGITVTQLYDKEDISEGEVKVSEDIWMRQFDESPFIQLSFWEFGVSKNPRWNWWWRLKIAWHVFREGSAWPDQVIMKASVAKNLANHMLYMIGKAQKEMKMANKQPPLVKEEPSSGRIFEDVWPRKESPTEDPHPMYCVQHGGSAAGERVNREHGFKCPRCAIEDLGLE